MRFYRIRNDQKSSELLSLWRRRRRFVRAFTNVKGDARVCLRREESFDTITTKVARKLPSLKKFEMSVIRTDQKPSERTCGSLQRRKSAFFTTNRTRLCPVDRALSFVVRSVTIEDALCKLFSFALISWTIVWQCSHRKASTLESVDVGLAGDSLRREKSFERIDREFTLG